MYKQQIETFKETTIFLEDLVNLKWHQNPIIGSKVTAILLKWRILPSGGASAGEGLPAACAAGSFLKNATDQKVFHRYLVEKN